MVIAPSQVAAIDAWRAKQPGIPSRSEAIRRLVELGLEIASDDGKPETYDIGPPRSKK